MPTLRFPGFTEEWQKHSLDKLGTTIIGLTYSPSDVVKENGTIVFRSSNIQNGEIDYSDIVRVGKEIKPVLRTKESDILICARNGSSRLIGKNAILKKSDEGQTFGAFMMIYRSKYNKFIRQLLNTKRYSMQVAQNIGARINQITTSDLNNFIFNFPTNPHEQKKIADFLSLLDERIALQSKLIEDLKILKSAIVERMLQQETESTVILSSLGRFIRGVTYSTEDITDGDGTLVMRATNITTGNPLNFKSDVVTISKRVSKEQLIATNDIVICLANGSSALIGKNSVYDGGCLSSLTIGAFCGVFRPNHSFVKWLFQTSQYRTNVARSIQGGNGAIANLSPSDILTMKFALPNNDVLNMYDNLLNKIDDKLVTETKLLDDILSQKCYLLSAMLI